jgi:restriction endonuclease S subunit
LTVVPPELDGAVVSQDFPVFEIQRDKIIPFYLETIVQAEKFYGQIDSLVSGATGRRRTDVDSFLALQIPLPPLEVQNDIADKIRKQRQIIEGAERIEENWKPEYEKTECELKKLGDVIELQRGYDLPQYEFKDGQIPVMGSNGIIGYHNVPKHESPGVITGRSGTIGKVHYIEKPYWPHNTSLFVKDFKGNNPRFIYYLLQSIDLKGLADNTTAVPSLDRKNAYLKDVYLPSPKIQIQIVEKLDQQMQALESVRFLKSEAEKRIEEILAEVWREE